MLWTIWNLLGKHGYTAHWTVLNGGSRIIHYQTVPHRIAARNDTNQIWGCAAQPRLSRLSMRSRYVWSTRIGQGGIRPCEPTNHGNRDFSETVGI